MLWGRVCGCLARGGEVWRHTVRSIRSGPGAASPARGEQKLQFKLGKAKVNSLTIEKEIGWLDWLSTMEGRQVWPALSCITSPRGTGQAMHRAWFWGLTSIGGASIAIHWVAPKWLTRYYWYISLYCSTILN